MTERLALPGKPLIARDQGRAALRTDNDDRPLLAIAWLMS
jgi:hypothetical protein